MIPTVIIVVFVVVYVWWAVRIERDWQYYLRNGIPPRRRFTKSQQDQLDRAGITPWKGLK